jgi:hypothetical protein
MPWLTFEAPGRMTCLHQAQTSVGRSRPDVIAFFMCVTLDEQELATFKESAALRARLQSVFFVSSSVTSLVYFSVAGWLGPSF